MSCDHLRPARVWRKEAEAVTWSGGQDHWHWDNQNYFTTQLQMLVTNIFTSLTAPSTGIRTRVRAAVSRWWDLAVSGLLLSPPESEGEDCEEKSRKLQVKRVKAGLDTGIWALTQGLRTAGQYSVRQVSCNTWSVQTWPERQGPGRQLQSVLLVLETQSRARSLIQGPHREYWPG